jgi:hypothetical protein
VRGVQSPAPPRPVSFAFGGGGAMLRAVLITVALIAAGLLAWEFVPIQVIVWDGAYELTVRVESPDGRPRSVSCEAFGRREYADAAVVHPHPPESQRWSAVADPFEGQPITVQVAVSGRESPFGRELRRSQFKFLAVNAVMADGRRVGKVVEIPDSRVSREVAVTLP